MATTETIIKMHNSFKMKTRLAEATTEAAIKMHDSLKMGPRLAEAAIKMHDSLKIRPIYHYIKFCFNLMFLRLRLLAKEGTIALSTRLAYPTKTGH